MGLEKNWLFRPPSINFKILLCLHLSMLSFGFSSQVGASEATTEGAGCTVTGVDANETTSQIGIMTAEIAGLKMKVRALRSQVKLKQRENIQLLEEKDLIRVRYSEMETQYAKYKSLYCINVNVADTQLHSALDNQDEDAVKTLVDCGANVNAQNNRSETPLHRSALYRDNVVGTRLIKFLIDNQADINAQDKYNRTFLHILMNTIMNPSIREEMPLAATTLTPLQFQEFSSYLISKNMSNLFNIPSMKNVTPLLDAVREIEVDKFTLTSLQNTGVDFQALDENGFCVLAYAVLGNRSTQMLSDLISLGVTLPHQNTNKENITLLHIAAFNGNVENVKYLNNLGQDVNALASGGYTPLHLGLEGASNVLETTRTLINLGAKLNIKESRGMTPLDLAKLHSDNWLADRDEINKLLEG